MKITETYDDFLNEKGKKPSTKSKVKKITKKIAKVVGKKEDLVKTAKEMAKSPDPSGKMQASLAKVQLKQSDAEAEKLVLQRQVEVLKSKISTAKEKEKAAKELKKANKTNEGMIRVKLYEEFINESDERDWNDKRRGPHPYDRGLTDKEEEEKEEQMKDQAKMDDDDPDAYKEMPGDKEAREKGEVKTSKHVKSYHELYGDEDEKNEAVDADDIDNAKFRLKNVYKHLDVEYGETRRGDKYVQIHYIPVTRPQSQNPEWVKVGYDNDVDLKKISKELGMDLKESVLNEEKAEGDRGPIDDEKVEKALKEKSEETGVPLEFLRIVMRRGMAAWKTGHRPGAGVHQWGYARVNSFLTKQEGTWGGADSDVAKEVRDGGHDKKLKKA